MAGLSDLQKTTNIKGTPHRLAWVNPEEEVLMKNMGGSGRMRKGFPSYDIEDDNDNDEENEAPNPGTQTSTSEGKTDGKGDGTNDDGDSESNGKEGLTNEQKADALGLAGDQRQDFLDLLEKPEKKDPDLEALSEAEEAIGGGTIKADPAAADPYGLSLGDETANKVIDDLTAAGKKPTPTEEMNIREAIRDARASGSYFEEELEKIGRANVEALGQRGGYWDPYAISGVGYRDLDTGLTGMREGFSDLYKMTGLDKLGLGSIAGGLLSALFSPEKEKEKSKVEIPTEALLEIREQEKAADRAIKQKEDRDRRAVATGLGEADYYEYYDDKLSDVGTQAEQLDSDLSPTSAQKENIQAEQQDFDHSPTLVQKEIDDYIAEKDRGRRGEDITGAELRGLPAVVDKAERDYADYISNKRERDYVEKIDKLATADQARTDTLEEVTKRQDALKMKATNNLFDAVIEGRNPTEAFNDLRERGVSRSKAIGLLEDAKRAAREWEGIQQYQRDKYGKRAEEVAETPYFDAPPAIKALPIEEKRAKLEELTSKFAYQNRLQKNEGFNPKAYKDVSQVDIIKGVDTKAVAIGSGIQLKTPEGKINEENVRALENAWETVFGDKRAFNLQSILDGQPVPEEVLNIAFDRITSAHFDAVKSYLNKHKLSPEEKKVAQEALATLRARGGPGLLDKMPKTVDAIQRGDFKRASEEVARNKAGTGLSLIARQSPSRMANFQKWLEDYAKFFEKQSLKGGGRIDTTLPVLIKRATSGRVQYTPHDAPRINPYQLIKDRMKDRVLWEHRKEQREKAGREREKDDPYYVSSPEPEEEIESRDPFHKIREGLKRQIIREYEEKQGEQDYQARYDADMGLRPGPGQADAPIPRDDPNYPWYDPNKKEPSALDPEPEEEKTLMEKYFKKFPTPKRTLRESNVYLAELMKNLRPNLTEEQIHKGFGYLPPDPLPEPETEPVIPLPDPRKPVIYADQGLSSMPEGIENV